jgi:hypothetical protein
MVPVLVKVTLPFVAQILPFATIGAGILVMVTKAVLLVAVFKQESVTTTEYNPVSAAVAEGMVKVLAFAPGILDRPLRH